MGASHCYAIDFYKMPRPYALRYAAASLGPHYLLAMTENNGRCVVVYHLDISKETVNAFYNIVDEILI